MLDRSVPGTWRSGSAWNREHVGSNPTIPTKKGEGMKECINCGYITSAYPLDPKGSLYCDIIEDYVLPTGYCFQYILVSTELNKEKGGI